MANMIMITMTKIGTYFTDIGGPTYRLCAKKYHCIYLYYRPLFSPDVLGCAM